MSFAEASLLPIPIFLLLIPLRIKQPRKSQRFYMLALAASVAGSIYGYALGHFAHLFFNQSSSNWLNGGWLIHSINQKGLIVIFLFCLLPLPFRVVAIAAGAASVGVMPFVFIAALGRAIHLLILIQLSRLFDDKHPQHTLSSHKEKT